MIIIPAIDILNGSCVRLVKGEYGSAHKVAADAVETAGMFEKQGAEYIHTVDLNGAKEGRTVNSELLCKIVKSVNIPVEIGGGIRDMSAVEFYLENGFSRVILGSAALKNPDLVKTAVKAFGSDHIAVGIDCKNGYVSASGWLETSEVHYIEFARIMEDCGVGNIIFTDISRDGTLTGPNLEQLKELSEAVSVDITASGGVKDINDIKSLIKLKLYGAIAGKAVYSGTLSVEEAVKICLQKE